MTYQVPLAGSGLIGWQYLQSNQTNQIKLMEESSSISTDLEYFRENIHNVETVEDLVSDYRLMSVALSAFGLSDQIQYTALLQKVLEEGVEDSDSLANRLASTDSRFLAFAEAFSFTPVVNTNTVKPGFADEILSRFEEKSSENIAAMELEYAAEVEEYILSGATAEEVEGLESFYAREIENQIEEDLENAEYFRDNISSVTIASELILNGKLLDVALTAFDSKPTYSENGEYFYLKIQRVLEGGVENPNSLANVLGDQNLIEMSAAFGFDNAPTLNIHDEQFIEGITQDFVTYEFEESVGNQYQELRYALNFKRAIPDMADPSVGDNAKWYQVLANESLREVFQTALGLPSEFAYIDIDSQLEQLKEKTYSRFHISSFDEMSGDAVLQEIINSFLLINEAQSGAYSASSGQHLVTLLGGATA